MLKNQNHTKKKLSYAFRFTLPGCSFPRLSSQPCSLECQCSDTMLAAIRTQLVGSKQPISWSLICPLWFLNQLLASPDFTFLAHFLEHFIIYGLPPTRPTDKCAEFFLMENLSFLNINLSWNQYRDCKKWNCPGIFETHFIKKYNILWVELDEYCSVSHKEHFLLNIRLVPG